MYVGRGKFGDGETGLLKHVLPSNILLLLLFKARTQRGGNFFERRVEPIFLAVKINILPKIVQIVRIWLVYCPPPLYPCMTRNIYALLIF